MAGKNNQEQKLIRAALKKHRFAIRKLTIGAASVLLGTFFWLESPVTTVHADITGQDDQIALQKKNQGQNEDSAALTQDNQSDQESGQEQENKPDKTNEAGEQQPTSNQQNNDDSEQELIFKPRKDSKLGGDAGKFLLDEKFRSGDSAAEQKQEVKRADNSADSQFKNGDANWGSVNIADWQYDNHTARGSITLTGYRGLDKAHIVIPNDQDFMAAGHLFASGQGVYISADTIHQIIHEDEPQSLAISQTKNGIVKASGSDWSNAFGGAVGGIFSLDGNLARMDLTNLDTSAITNMHSMLSQSANLTTVGDLSAWNTSHVTDMSSLFMTNFKLANLGNLDNWDTSEVTDMSGMFAGTPKLTNIGNIGSWKVSKVLYFETMFSGCGLTTAGDIGNWQLNTVFNPNPYDPSSNLNFIRIDHMFSGSHFVKLDLSGWNTKNVEYMAGIFADARDLKEINISGWNFSGVTRMPDGNDDPTNVYRFAAGNKDQVIIANNLIGLDTEADRARVGLKATDFSSDHSDRYGHFISDGHDVVITNNPVLLGFEKEKEVNQKDYGNSRYGFNGLKFYNDKITEGIPGTVYPDVDPTILSIPKKDRNAWSQLWLTNPTWDNIDSYDGNYYFYLPAFYQSNGESDPLKVIKSYIAEAVQKEAAYLKNNAASPFRGKDIGVHLAGLYFNGQEISLWPGEDGFLSTPNNPSEHLSDAEAQRRQDALLAQLATEDPDALAVALVNAKYVVRVNNNVTPPSNPTVPTNPTSPSNPTNVQPSQPTNPASVQPTQPIIPPHSQINPTKKSTRSTNRVTKHKVNRTTTVRTHERKVLTPRPVILHSKKEKMSPVATKEALQGHTRPMLPKTGKHAEHLAELGLIALGFATLLTLIEPKSKKKRE